MRGLSGTGLGRGGLFTFGVITLLAIGTFALAGREMLKRVDAQPAKRAIQATAEAVAQTAAKTADKTEPKSKADQVERAVEEPDPVPDKASDSASASGSAPASASPPADTAMWWRIS